MCEPNINNTCVHKNTAVVSLVSQKRYFEAEIQFILALRCSFTNCCSSAPPFQVECVARFPWGFLPAIQYVAHTTPCHALFSLHCQNAFGICQVWSCISPSSAAICPKTMAQKWVLSQQGRCSAVVAIAFCTLR